jgi:hypothetical protein
MEEAPDTSFDFNVVALDRVEFHSFLADDLQGRILFYRDHR